MRGVPRGAAGTEGQAKAAGWAPRERSVCAFPFNAGMDTDQARSLVRVRFYQFIQLMMRTASIESNHKPVSSLE